MGIGTWDAKNKQGREQQNKIPVHGNTKQRAIGGNMVHDNRLYILRTHRGAIQHRKRAVHRQGSAHVVHHEGKTEKRNHEKREKSECGGQLFECQSHIMCASGGTLSLFRRSLFSRDLFASAEQHTYSNDFP